MAKPPRVIGVLTEPARPTWWRAHRHKVLFVAGLFLGYQLAIAAGAAPAEQPPRPGHTTPALQGPVHITPRHSN
ncbi:hypothetical protein ACTWQF_34080 [Streptomyces sp. 8N114]|uniref:hypothetical protein n=1 Tax=Streptomyces sp. 8N114 TaxID=3457419 RepID=UPI003FD323FB